MRHTVTLTLLIIILTYFSLPAVSTGSERKVVTKSDSIALGVVFRQSMSRVEPEYLDNRSNLDSFVNKVTELYNDPESRIIPDISAYASPEGPLQRNRQLSRQRVENIAGYLKKRLPFIPDSTFRLRHDGINWTGLERLVGESDMAFRDDVLTILRDTPEETILNGARVETRLNQLKRLHGGIPYRYMYRRFFPQLRNAELRMQIGPEYAEMPMIAETELATMPVLPIPAMIMDTIHAPKPNGSEGWQRHAYVKTNLPAWICFWTNIAGEIDLAPHWSLNLSVYYSGFDYFRRTLKFRTFSVMPEARFWFCGQNDGLFLGIHPGMAYYNIALRGDNRYQDHRGRTPALGGGGSIGYRFVLPNNPRLKFEASAGYGIYALDYDIFENRGNGPLIGRRKRTFYGLDNVAFSICYTFDINKKTNK